VAASVGKQKCVSRDTFIGICLAVTGWPKEAETAKSGADAAPAAVAAPKKDSTI